MAWVFDAKRVFVVWWSRHLEYMERDSNFGTHCIILILILLFISSKMRKPILFTSEQIIINSGNAARISNPQQLNIVKFDKRRCLGYDFIHLKAYTNY